MTEAPIDNEFIPETDSNEAVEATRRTLREFKDGPGTRGPIVRERKPQVIPAGNEGPSRPKQEDLQSQDSGSASDITDKAEEDLTDLGEQETAAESENESAEQDSAEAAEQPIPQGSIAGEVPPSGYGSID